MDLLEIIRANGYSVESAAYLILAALLLLIAWIDLKTMLIPNWCIFLIFLAGLFFAFFSQEISWVDRFIGFFSAGGILFLIAVLSHGGLGGGDIKLMAAVGFYLGWKLTLWALFSASILGGFIGAGILAMGKGNLKTEIPYGPILVAGILSSMLFGEKLMNWYFSLL